MICEFCHKLTRLSHTENRNKDTNKDEVEVYDCLNCPVLTSFYIKIEDGSKIKTVFMLDRNEKIYMWTDHFDKKISYITDASVTLTLTDKDPLLIKFPKVMNVKPSNVHEKFKFYMLFL